MGVPLCIWLLYLAKRNKVREACALGGSGGMPPVENF